LSREVVCGFLKVKYIVINEETWYGCGVKYEKPDGRWEFSGGCSGYNANILSSFFQN
jgi:hypothetical protein